KTGTQEVCQTDSQFVVVWVIRDGFAQYVERLGETSVDISFAPFLMEVFGENAKRRGKFARISGIIGKVPGQTAEDGDSVAECILRLLSLATDLVDPSCRDISDSTLKPDFRLVGMLL